MAVRTSTLTDGTVVIAVAGSLVSTDALDMLHGAVTRCVEEKHARLILDLSKVTYMSSMAIGELISTHTSYSRRHWQFCVCGINEKLYPIFTITRLNRVLHLRPTVNDAIQSFT